MIDHVEFERRYKELSSDQRSFDFLEVPGRPTGEEMEPKIKIPDIYKTE